MAKRFVSLLLGALAALMLGQGSAMAASSDWVANDFAAVRLISAVDTTGEAEVLPLGLEFRLEEGWKIYWRTPGDAGFPPVPDWSASDNVSSTEMGWPVPERFTIFDIGTLGYHDSVVFPLHVTPSITGAPVSFAGTVDYLICEEICIPGHAELSLTLPSGPTAVSDEAHLIDRFESLVPVTETGLAGLTVEAASVQTDNAGASSIEIRVASLGGALIEPDAFLEGPGGIYFDRPTVSLEQDGSGAVLSVPVPSHVETASLLSDGFVATVIDGGRALEATVIPSEGALPAVATAIVSQANADPMDFAPSFIAILGLALVGGLILNLMPCVLPVLSLKLLSVASKSGKESGQVRTGLLITAAGVIASFWVLALGAIALRQAGLSVGWGIQFQQPVFLALMVALLTLFACNLIGLFEFRLPGSIGDRAASAGGNRDGYVRDFLTGAFATLLATPCSAPFLGTAVGFALGAGSIEIALVFTMLGIGLALPYLLVAMFPGMVRVFPKPGPWMVWLKWILALALVGTAVWLLTVMGAIIGDTNAAAVGALAAVAAAALATRHLEGSRVGRLAWPVSGALAIACVLSPLAMEREAAMFHQAEATEVAEEAIDWQPFDLAAIPALVADGNTVFVDVTADWCVTCKWNKRTVLDAGEVAEWLDGDRVIAMRADWTRPDPTIAAYLESHGRYGIPFNIVYGPNAPEGMPLPELLSEAAVLSAARMADPSAWIASSEE